MDFTFLMSCTHLSKNTEEKTKPLFISHLYAYMLWVALAIFLFSYNFSRTLFTFKKIRNKTPFIMGISYQSYMTTKQTSEYKVSHFDIKLIKYSV